jgi:hypothetical protein
MALERLSPAPRHRARLTQFGVFSRSEGLRERWRTLSFAFRTRTFHGGTFVKIALTRPSAFAALFVVVLAVGATSAEAQALPSGSYQRSCEQIHWAGTTLVAECRKADGRPNGTGLPTANRCVGDIGNNNGQLQCNYASGAQSPSSSPAPRSPSQPSQPSQGYNPSQGNGYPSQGYNPSPGAPNYPPPGYGGYQSR